MSTDGTVAAPATSGPTSLRSGAVALWGDFIASITNVAPSAAVALTLGAILGVAGRAGPFIVLVVGFAMLCIAFAFHRLNLWQPTAAAQAIWVARTVRPLIGLALGLMVMIESVVSNIANITLFGPYFLGIVAPGAASNGFLEWIVSALATGIVVLIAIVGIKAAIRFQTYVVWVEYAIMLAFAGFLLHAEFSGVAGAVHPSLAWLLPTASPTAGGIVTGIVIGVFMFGGWECSVYLAEEQTEARHDPGRAGIIAVIFCTVWFIFLIMAIQAIAPVDALVKHQANLIAYAAGQAASGPLATLVSLAVLSSVLAVVQSQLQNFSRIGFGLAREGLLPKWMARLSQAQTPWIGLILASVFPVVLLIAYLANGTAAQALTLVTGTAGILYIVLYVAAALACVWYYRRTLTRTAGQLFSAGILPLVGAAVLIFALIAAIPNTAVGTLIPAAIFVLIGIPVAYYIKVRTKAPFFDQKPVVAEVNEPADAAAR